MYVYIHLYVHTSADMCCPVCAQEERGVQYVVTLGTCCNVLQCVAVCYSVLQYVAVWFSDFTYVPQCCTEKGGGGGTTGGVGLRGKKSAYWY